MFGYTAAAGAALLAPAALQALLVLHPELVGADAAGAVMSFALAGAFVAVPALFHAMLALPRNSRIRGADA